MFRHRPRERRRRRPGNLGRHRVTSTVGPDRQTLDIGTARPSTSHSESSGLWQAGPTRYSSLPAARPPWQLDGLAGRPRTRIKTVDHVHLSACVFIIIEQLWPLHLKKKFTYIQSIMQNTILIRFPVTGIFRSQLWSKGEIAKRYFRETRCVAREGKAARTPLESRRYVDRSRILVAGGAGGSGCVSFARQVSSAVTRGCRDKYLLINISRHRAAHEQWGGPDGGGGGDGGNVYVEARSDVLDLSRDK